MGRLIAWVASWMMFLFVVSCAADTASPDGAGAHGNATVLPASLRLEALRAMQAAPGYDFASEDGALVARVGALGGEAWAEVGRDGVELTRLDGSFALGVRTAHVGRRGAERGAPPVAEVRADGQEAVLAWGGVEERYLAGPLGLEQSYRIEARPAGAGPLVIEVAFDGLRPEPAAGAEDALSLVDGAGTTRATYRELAAVDAEGRDLAARMEIGARGVTLVVDDAAAAYPVVVDPLVATEVATLTASDADQYDHFGCSVSMSGDTAIIGAYGKKLGASEDTGAAYIFVRNGASWSEQARLTASDAHQADLFGISVSVSGDTAIVGAYKKQVGANTEQGAAYVFVRSGTTWSEEAKLTASDGASNDNFGFSVSVSGNTAIVGAPYKTISPNKWQGAAYVFVRSGTTWLQEAKLTASDGASSDAFGFSVSLSGDTAIIGAGGANSGQGAAYVFVRSGATWSEQAKLTASDGTADDIFGNSVSLSADTAIIGARQKKIGGNPHQGEAYIFVRSGTTWSEQAKLKASDGAAYDTFGRSVSVSGDTAIVGAPSKMVGSNMSQGAAYVFVRSGTVWSQQQAQPVASDAAPGDWFGSVAVSGDTVLVGAEYKTFGVNTYQGEAYVFALKKGQGDACADVSECASGYCVDGVCCDTACDAGACDACSKATGAAVDGTCALLTGTTCDDGDASTTGDVCTAGVCAGVDHCTGVTCTAQDECHDAGTCVDHATGACDNPVKADGTPCSMGICTAGVCTSSTSSTSSSTSASSTSSSGGGSGGGEAGSGGGEAGSDGGCGCHTAGGGDTPGMAWLGAVGLALVSARRRRARHTARASSRS